MSTISPSDFYYLLKNWFFSFLWEMSLFNDVCFAYVYVYILPMCLVTAEARRRCQIPLELELLMVVNYYLSAGNQT